MDIFGWEVPDAALRALIPIAALIAALFVHSFVFLIARRAAADGLDASLVRHSRMPTRVMVGLAASLFVLPAAQLSPDGEEIVTQAISLGFIGSVGWLAIALLSIADDLVAERYPTDQRDNLEARAVQTRMRVLRSVGLAIIGVITVSAMLMTFPDVRQIGVSLLASAGVIALVVGMAARPALSNILAGLQIAITQPIRIDDVLIVEGEWGRVEEIKATFVVLRIWDSRALVIPLSYFVEHPVENWTLTGADILGSAFVYVDYTVPVAEVRDELRRILETCALWDGRVCSLQVTNTTDRAQELRALMSARDSSEAWDLRCEVRERLTEYLQRRFPTALPRTRTSVDLIERPAPGQVLPGTEGGGGPG